MTYHGRADMLITPTAPQKWNEAFTGIVEFLTGSLAQSLGIQTVETNRGTGARGFSYWDGASNSGPRAWAVFRFLSSSMGQFDMSIFVNSGASGVNDPWQVGSTTNTNTTAAQGNIGIAFAMHPSGTVSVPWNGSSGSFVSGTAGNPVWKTDANGKLTVWPRQNSQLDGIFAAKRNYSANIIPDDGNVWRAHLIVSEESITFAVASPDTQNYKLTHFGPWTPRSGSAADTPYMMLQNTSVGTAVEFYNNIYGFNTVQTINAREGGVGHPLNAASGSRFGTLVSLGPTIDANIGAFNNFINSGSFDLLPLYAAIKDGTDVGILGQLRNINCGFNMTPHSVTPGSGSVCFGGNTAATMKFVVPWSGSNPGFVNTRAGRDW